MSQISPLSLAVVPEPGGPGGPLAPPIFGRSVNPIPTGGGQIIPTYYYWPPQSFSPSGITASSTSKYQCPTEACPDLGPSSSLKIPMPH
jgi:hypothetical protein